MPFDATRYLANMQLGMQHRYELAIGDNRSSEEIAQLEQMLTAIAILLEQRVHQHTIH